MTVASSSPRPPALHSLAAPRIQRLTSSLQQGHRRLAIRSTAAPIVQLVCPLDDDDDDEESSSTSTSSSSASNNLPLCGARVLITAPRSYAASLGSRLLAAGARPLSVPGVRTLRLRRGGEEERELDEALRDLLGIRSGSTLSSFPSPSAPSRPPPFAAVAFTSRAGIEAVLERIAALSSSSEVSRFPRRREEVLAAGGAAIASAAFSSPSSPSFTLWALGADADALASAGVPAALVRTPQEASTTGLVAAMAGEEEEEEEEAEREEK